MDNPDLLVVGGGTAALSVARTARRRDASVVLISDGPLGGDCTFTGCVPSKTLLSSGDLPFADAMARVHATIASIAADEDAATLRSEGVHVVEGTAEVLSRREVRVDGKTFRPGNIVLALGSQPVVPPIDGLDTVPYLTNENLFDLTELPKHLIVLGGGAIGAEMAQAFRRFGAKVTVLEASDRLLSKEEPKASEVITARFRELGIDVRAGEKMTGVTRSRGVLTVTTDKGTVKGSHLLVAVGRTPLVRGVDALDLKKLKNGAIEVDLRMRTSIKGVFAAGDCTGRLPFTHAADEMGRVAVGNALGRLPQKFAEHAVPWVTFTDPEVARLGLTEAEAAEQIKGARVVEVPMGEVDRARTADRTEGFVKIVVAPRRLTRNLGGGKVVGATIVGPRAGEMIAEVVLAVRAGMFAGRLAQATHAYPTWSLGVQQAVAQLFGGGYGGRQPRPAERG